MTKFSTSSVHHPAYNEPEALQELLVTSQEFLNDCQNQYEATDEDLYLETSFSINIGGKSFAFILGGPQFQALHNFINSIADENGYTVDLVNSTVTE